jgi:hypothetical protein
MCDRSRFHFLRSRAVLLIMTLYGRSRRPFNFHFLNRRRRSETFSDPLRLWHLSFRNRKMIIRYREKRRAYVSYRYGAG